MVDVYNLIREKKTNIEKRIQELKDHITNEEPNCQDDDSKAKLEAFKAEQAEILAQEEADLRELMKNQEQMKKEFTDRVTEMKQLNDEFEAQNGQ